MGDMRNYTRIEHYERDEITNLLLYRKIVKVDGDTLVLDNGIELEIVPNKGCSGCTSGNYDITELNGCDNAITSLEFVEGPIDFDDWMDYSYQIFVYAEDTKIKILQVDGTDGNGFYGTGYSIRVRGIKK